MKFFDAGQEAVGIIAVGQVATGVFAFGQMATGVIAIGQVARGGLAIGQVAFGLVGWGQGGAGVFHAVGMLGVGGRGFGPVLRLVPSIGRPRELPPVTTLAAVAAGEDGWIDVQLSSDLGLWQGGARLPVKLDRRLQRRAVELAGTPPQRVLAYTRRIGPVLICDRLAYEPVRPHRKPGFWRLATLQLVGLLALGTAYSALVGHHLVVALEKIVDDSPPPPARPAAPAPRPPRGRSR
jgi:hypothetical protein